MTISLSSCRRVLPILLFASICWAGEMSPAYAVEEGNTSTVIDAAPATGEQEAPAEFSAFTKLRNMRDKAADLADNAMNMLGIRYHRGGNTPETGLDCSGFVRYVFKHVGVELPRTSREISKIGEKISTKDLQPGDLVFYNTLRKGFSHVGIYLGDNKFVHAPSAGGQIRVESMDLSYWKKRFNGARRVEDFGADSQ